MVTGRFSFTLRYAYIMMLNQFRLPYWNFLVKCMKITSAGMREQCHNHFVMKLSKFSVWQIIFTIAAYILVIYMWAIPFNSRITIWYQSYSFEYIRFHYVVYNYGKFRYKGPQRWPSMGLLNLDLRQRLLNKIVANLLSSKHNHA